MDLAMLKSQREELKKQQGKLEAKLTVTYDTDTDAGKIRNLAATHINCVIKTCATLVN